MEHLARNMSISEFATLANVPVSTVRDWNKRGLSNGIGQPGPNGHWLYSRSDVRKVQIASILYGEGLSWRTGLFAGNVMVSHLEGREMKPSEPYYQNRYFAFCGWALSENINWGCGPTCDEAFHAAHTGPTNFSIWGHSTIVIDLNELAGVLPATEGKPLEGY
ncbi:hypothetical protein ROJ8625_00691 [Roseivivax jejudonensis]|uniref:HTH merR-type domain-containing protein n=1 Tax=Roseivivax jejudonensis TaxID=1529041 RepID=A0A1X6YFB7_9RHOB|nr:MerR family transcriptional regulator [Roseivivax jejudonensis]SLN19794.1 hypothetical protein ROJ8625_00691 [Roseivivax jejudonensis]